MIDKEHAGDVTNPHYNLSNVKKSLNSFRDEYNARLKLLNAAYAKIYTILIENNINPKVIDNMVFKVNSDYNIIFQLFEKPIQFGIDIQLKKPKSEPYLKFAIRNPKTGFNIEEVMYIFKQETTLSTHFVMFFRNNFQSYYVVSS